MVYHVNELNKIEPFQKFIMKISSDYNPPLLPRIEIGEYYNKLKDNAVTISCTNENNDIVGFLAVYCNDFKTKRAYIPIVGVLNEYRCQGIASHLVDMAICESKMYNMQCVGIHTNNEYAKACYIKAGFKIHDEMIKDGYTRYYMERSL